MVFALYHVNCCRSLQVEGLADLLAADTAEQRRQALRQVFKVLSVWHTCVRMACIMLKSHQLL